MVTIFVTVQNQGTIADLEMMLYQLANLQEPLANAGLFWSDRMASNFASAPWPPLAESTLRYKEAMGYPSDPLIRTGAMHDTATGGEWNVSGNTAWLTLPDYSGFHFTGTQFMPSRDFSDLDDATVIEMAMQFVEWVLEPLGA